MGREYFSAYHSYLAAIQELDDAERGRLFTACLEYSGTGEVIRTLTGNERFVWPSMRSQIDRDKKRYDDTERAYAARARKGAEARWRKARGAAFPETFRGGGQPNDLLKLGIAEMKNSEE